MSEGRTTAYWPRVEVDGEVLELLEIHLCIDFGGRQAHCEFQNAANLATSSASYYYLSNEWTGIQIPNDAPLTSVIRSIFATFDDGSSTLAGRDARG